MYNIILKNEKIIKVKADKVEWYEKTHMIKLIDDGDVVAIVNMDNVVGLIDTYYKIEYEK